jgi:glycerate dehydrogenase
MERFVFLDRDTVRADFRSPNFAHEWIEYPMTQPEDVIERVRNATIAVTNKVALRKKDLEQLPKLRMIAVAATGIDCVDADYCRDKGIPVLNVRNYAVHSVPEHVFTLILALRRNLIAYQEAVQSGKWQNSEIFCLLDYPIHDLHNSTLGIIGYGTLGQRVEKLACAFGLNVIISEHKSAANVRSGRVSFEEVLAKSDIITLHCPLTNETFGLIGATELSKMKRGALLINCARGGLVDEKALGEALQNRLIAGAGVDVLTGEPPSSGNPLINANLPNFLVTPHIAWASMEAMQMLADALVDNLESFVKSSFLTRN